MKIKQVFGQTSVRQAVCADVPKGDLKHRRNAKTGEFGDFICS